jgi:hypothetical protein
MRFKRRNPARKVKAARESITRALERKQATYHQGCLCGADSIIADHLPGMRRNR